MTSSTKQPKATVVSPAVSDETLSLVDAVIEQVRGCQSCLEVWVGLEERNEDALIYLMSAEMHLKAARCRLERL